MGKGAIRQQPACLLTHALAGFRSWGGGVRANFTYVHAWFGGRRRGSKRLPRYIHNIAYVWKSSKIEEKEWNERTPFFHAALVVYCSFVSWSPRVAKLSFFRLAMLWYDIVCCLP